MNFADLIKYNLLSVCKEHLPFRGKVQVDGIFSVLGPEEGQQVVVKVRETLEILGVENKKKEIETEEKMDYINNEAEKTNKKVFHQEPYNNQTNNNSSNSFLSPFSCKKCSLVFSDSLSLSVHHSNIHRLFTCSICLQTFPFYYLFHQHLLFHASYSLFQKNTINRFDRCLVENPIFEKINKKITEQSINSEKHNDEINLKNIFYNEKNINKNLEKEHFSQKYIFQKWREGSEEQKKFGLNLSKWGVFCQQMMLRLGSQGNHGNSLFLEKLFNQQYQKQKNLQEQQKEPLELKINSSLDSSFSSSFLPPIPYQPCQSPSNQSGSCSICGNQVETLEDLEIHCFVAHKRSPCFFCSKTFAQKANRDRHCRIHTGKKPYKCDECGEKFQRGDKLKMHKDKKHCIHLKIKNEEKNDKIIERDAKIFEE